MSDYRYDGIKPEILMLLSENRFRNSRDFYEENKKKIKEGITIPLQQIICALSDTIIEIDEDIPIIPQKMVSRVRRDTRYTKDKHMYRENLWTMFTRDKHSLPHFPCMWFEVAQNGYSGGVGTYYAPPRMMELYRQEGVNPFGGCLPILLQIPVFFALYATLDGAVELRQVPFWWCKDLAAADTVAKIPLYFFDLPINPLVLAMTLLMALQQRMTPMSGDPMQKKMMMMMPAFMLIFLYDLPSGLTLYWTVSNLFSIIQLKLQQRAGKVSVAAK
jgi:YidC/Oxa1 family membrane protein insertase